MRPSSPTSPPLLPIIAHARSGALDHAWRMFREAGLEGVEDDPAVLSVRGRLLKDRGQAASGSDRRRLFLEAASAYAKAGEIGGATYPLINAATLSRLAGEAEQSRDLAAQVLDRISFGQDEAETPYWRAATEAEALLLLGRVGEARRALEAAVVIAPRAWEDHASTLRQFGLILADLGEDAAWLDVLRPPRSLHFAGHMAVGRGAKDIAERVAETLEAENIGFGYGALAAGADILIAEALLERGAELHLVLPAGREAFREVSVARPGPDWAERFDAVIARADSVRSVVPAACGLHPLGVRLAAEAAMGAAVMQARTLASEAVQLLILDHSRPEADVGGVSAWISAVWTAVGRREHVLSAPRTRAAGRRDGEASHDDHILLAAMLSVGLDGGGPATIEALAEAVQAGPTPMLPPRWAGTGLALAFETPAKAAKAALHLSAALEGARIGGHYGLARRTADPFGGPPLLLDAAAGLPAQILASVPPQAIHVSEDFACALHAAQAGDRPRTEYVGDLPGDDVGAETRLFSLRP